MNNKLNKIVLGGGCHWCTEAVFQSLIGVDKVEQGYVASINENNNFSEAVIVHFNSELMPLKTLIEVHLYTHKSTSNHSMRSKYRSAVYTFSESQMEESENIIKGFQEDFENKLITKIYPFQSFKPSREAIQNYYQKDPNKPFCKTFIAPKLRFLLQRFSHQVNPSKVRHVEATTV
ncbi:peptide-methionine (S)-S-oxide reductase [Flavivirga eckloniae]|uniref:peptide-methionine (S)-S-oxide reductase n=1 Tax=Flavivirga eckloniae TaxID=1803846 RepID=A0A2K9PSZ4_9FLAO|nr:peptide-methionine (S)-S-oxide reductase [Flavivirga eckloniae]AUP80192.1 peptide methionine sulfoxide reductase [Flavivirga eckloniae]